METTIFRSVVVYYSALFVMLAMLLGGIMLATGGFPSAPDAGTSVTDHLPTPPDAERDDARSSDQRGAPGE